MRVLIVKCDTGVIVAGTSSVRQWIQRMGRILRKSPNKEFSKYTLSLQMKLSVMFHRR